MIHNILADIICKAFDKECGKWQSKKGAPKAFLLDFSVSIDHSKEEGYRQLQILLYAPANYVGVWVRETWDVISLDDLDEEGKIKPGKDYVKGQSDWKQECYHDSTWRSEVSDLIFKNRARLLTLGIGEPWKLIDPPERSHSSAFSKLSQ